MYGMEDRLTEFDGYKGRELGFVLGKAYWGQGFMPEAVRAIMNYLFNELDLDFLLCGHYDFNEQSKRVQEKCGFKPYRKLLKNAAQKGRHFCIIKGLSLIRRQTFYAFG